MFGRYSASTSECGSASTPRRGGRARTAEVLRRAWARAAALAPGMYRLGLMRARAWGVTLFVAGSVLACASTLRVPTPADATWASAQWPGATVHRLDDGRSLYVRKCRGCHRLYDPVRVTTSERWPAEFEEMSERAHLDSAEAELIRQYLLTASRPLPPEPAAP